MLIWVFMHLICILTVEILYVFQRFLIVLGVLGSIHMLRRILFSFTFIRTSFILRQSIEVKRRYLCGSAPLHGRSTDQQVKAIVRSETKQALFTILFFTHFILHLFFQIWIVIEELLETKGWYGLYLLVEDLVHWVTSVL